ncbi:MAG: hypothetical protein Kow00121_62730 [Elainellaceae cyanobacterium]
MKKVKDVVGACDTGLVRGLSEQIIIIMNSLVPNVLVNFSDLNVDVRGDQINPFLQPAAKESLRLAIQRRGTKLVVNSAYRTVAQQHIIRRQFEQRLCGIPAAARPGLSNHEGGLALDIEDPDGWQPFMQRHSWIRLGAFDPLHYDYRFLAAVRSDIGTIGIRAFQRLWNQYNPNDPIPEDGVFGPVTATRLDNSPADGFGTTVFPVLRLQTPPITGDEVRRLQRALVSAGFEVEVNGIFDAATDRAVRRFQEINGLSVDGVVGASTLKAIESSQPASPITPSQPIPNPTAGVRVEGIQIDALSVEARNALIILVNLSAANLNRIKATLGLGQPGVIGPTTLSKFLQLMKDLRFDLSEAGVNAFKEQNRLGNIGVMRGVIGPQTAQVYFDQILQRRGRSTGGSARQINQAGLELVKEFEGLERRLPDGRIAAYIDAVGVPTIGYGHTRGVFLGQVITREQAEQFLREDLGDAEEAVSSLVKVRLNDNQFAALVSFVFNLGAGALAGSTLLRELNAGNYQAAADQFPRWVNAGGRQLLGLVRRRAAERRLFLS